jgi:radical SAM protein with 4Fe4S-binding SPASM domain
MEERKKGCLDPWMFAAIDYNGSVMPCCCLRSDYHEDCVLGNLKDQSLEEILSGEKAVQFRNAAANAKTLPSVCRHCQKGIGRYTREEPGILYSRRYIEGGEE